MVLFLCQYPYAATVRSAHFFLPSVCKHETTVERLKQIFIEFDLRVYLTFVHPFQLWFKSDKNN